MNFNEFKISYKPLLVLSILPFLFILGKAVSNTFSVIIAIFGIYILIRKSYFKFLNNNFFKFYIFFLFCLFFSSITSYNIVESFNTTIPYSLFIFFIISHIFILNNYEKSYFEKFLFFSYLALTIVILFSFYEFFFKLEINDKLEYYHSRDEGLQSVFSYKILGNYIQKFLPIFLA